MQSKAKKSNLSQAVQSNIKSSQTRAGTVGVQIEGPLPSSMEMERYKHVYPELPKDIVDMAKNEQKETYSLRNKIIDARIRKEDNDFRLDRIALIFCFILCFIFIGCAAYFFAVDKYGVASFFTVSAFIAIPKYFLWPSKKDKNSEK